MHFSHCLSHVRGSVSQTVLNRDMPHCIGRHADTRSLVLHGRAQSRHGHEGKELGLRNLDRSPASPQTPPCLQYPEVPANCRASDEALTASGCGCIQVLEATAYLEPFAVPKLIIAEVPKSDHIGKRKEKPTPFGDHNGSVQQRSNPRLLPLTKDRTG